MGQDKLRGSDAILFNAKYGALVDTGDLTEAVWYKVVSQASASALPPLQIGSIFKTPEFSADKITLVSGDSVRLAAFDEICKVDINISLNQDVVDTTDSCDYPFTSNLPTGIIAATGTINTMLRFDPDTREIMPVTQEMISRFFPVINDDGEGTYTFSPVTNEDMMLMICLNRNDMTVAEKYTTWLTIPAFLSAMTLNVAQKEINKGEYSWVKGAGPMQLYSRYTPLAV